MKLPTLLLAALLLAFPAYAPAAGARASDGYALLYYLAEKEKKADLIFLLKTGSPKVQETTKQISKLFGQLDDDIKKWADDDKAIKLTSPLPALEDEVRAEIDKDHTKELFDTKGKPFDHLFMVLQWQSLYYASHLCEAVQAHETNDARAKAIGRYAVQFRKLARQVYSQI